MRVGQFPANVGQRCRRASFRSRCQTAPRTKPARGPSAWDGAGVLRAAAAENTPPEMLLLDLYGALHPLDAITGKTTADDILNRIFSTFCIGK
jgi:hypothetical protein